MEIKKFINSKSALICILLTLPHVLLSIIASNEIEPFFSFFKIPTPTDFGMNPIGFLALLFSMFLLLIAIWSLFRREADGKRRFYLVNFIIAAFILMYFVIFVGAWIKTAIFEASAF